jgi:tetratricopeptide (TPR) repeat protein
MNGVLRLAQGDRDAADSNVEKRAKAQPQLVGGAPRQGPRAVRARPQLAEALAEIRLARPRDPDAEVELWTGKIAERSGKPQEAAAAFAAPASSTPRCSRPPSSTAAPSSPRASPARRSPSSAVTARHRRPTPAAHLALGLALREREQLPEALQSFLRAARPRPEPRRGRSTGPDAPRAELGRHADALYHLRRAVLAQNPGPWHADAHLWLARALVKQNQRDEATSMYTTYLRLAGPRAAARAEAEKMTRGH